MQSDTLPRFMFDVATYFYDFTGAAATYPYDLYVCGGFLLLEAGQPVQNRVSRMFEPQRISRTPHVALRLLLGPVGHV